MSLVEWGAAGVAGLFLAVALGRILAAPAKLALRLGLNAALGLGALWLLQQAEGYTGLHLGLNLFNAATVGVLGLPGLGLLCLLQWVLT